MPRLFVAIDFPEETKRALVRIQPQAIRGIRCTKAELMHLTLHFLGEADVDPVVTALATVRAAAFRLMLGGVGKFGFSRQGFILWVGITAQTSLLSLHAKLADALLTTGYQPESRPYSPHITLARCQSDVPRRVIDEFLQQEIAAERTEFPVTEFSLYSSTLTADGPVYRRLQAFLLEETP